MRKNIKLRHLLVYLGIGALAVVVVTIGLISFPLPALAVITGLPTLWLCFRRPPIALAIVMSSSALALPVRLAGVDGAVLSTGSFVVAAVGALGALSRIASTVRNKVVGLLTTVALLVLVGVLVARQQLDLIQALQGARIFATPVLCAAIGFATDARAMRIFLRFTTVLLVLSFVAAIIESALGVRGLVQAGLESGTSVRTYDDLLRAPGLFTTNYSLGAFAGVAGALAAVWWRSLEPELSRIWWQRIAVTSALGCLILSTYRAGLLVFFISLIVWLATDRSAGIATRLGTSVAAIGLFVVVQVTGLTSASSLFQRLELWQSVLSAYPFRVLGYGLGYSGAASGSRFSSEAIVIDNYFLNLFIQIGALSILVFAIASVAAIAAVYRAQRYPLYSSGGVLLAVIAAFMVVDFWEYTAPMGLALAAVAVAHGISSERGGSSDTSSIPSPAGRQEVHHPALARRSSVRS